MQKAKRKSPPLGKRTWTPEDESYLAEKWGYASIPAIAKKLHRTENAVIVRARRLGLGAMLMAGGYVTLNQLLATVTGTKHGSTYQRKSWVENRGLPVHRKKVHRCSFYVVYLEEFWEWAERNRWRSAGNRHGWQSSARKITAPALSSARTRGRQTRTAA